MTGLNIGSGQRRFDRSHGWINCDLVVRPGEEPDVQCSGAALPFADGSMDVVVLHQVLEHAGSGESDGMLAECWRVLRAGGSLLIFLPDLKALAMRWLVGGISDFIYVVNLMGAYRGLESDRHRWHYTGPMLAEALTRCGTWRDIQPFDWRAIPGSDLARDFWVLAEEAVK